MRWMLLSMVEDLLDKARAVHGDSPPEGFEARGESTQLLKVSGRRGEILVQGVLTNTPDWLAQIFGGGNTTYPDIIKALTEAEADPKVKEIFLRVNSPGGSVIGMVSAMDAIHKFKKPIVAVVEGMATSAAYGLASQADKIIASDRSSMVGSIGVVVSKKINPEIVDIASTKAPKKRPDATTDEGLAAIREELDAIHSIFSSAIARGRGVPVKTVDSDFGQGAVVMAGDALKSGMIDAIGVTKRNSRTTPESNGGQNKGQKMNLQEFKAQHPELYAEVKASGVAKERERVTAHLELGDASGDLSVAITAVTEGTELTTGVQAKYLAASMRKAATDNRVGDNVTVPPGAKADPEVDELEAQTMAQFESGGVEMFEDVGGVE